MEQATLDYGSLKLVEKPDGPRNTGRLLQQTLEGCEGYIKSLPLRAPNVYQKMPKTITDMVNILTHSNAEELFLKALRDHSSNNHYVEMTSTSPSWSRQVGEPLAIYNPDDSPLMKRLLETAETSHVPAYFGVFGDVIDPGCAGFYKVDGETFAVPPGRWALTGWKASWIDRNVSLDRETISFPGKSQVLIVRVPPGNVGCIFDQGNSILLDVGTHVFNSGTVKFHRNIPLASTSHFGHGKYHYVRVPRGRYAKVWAEQLSPETRTKSLVPCLLQEGEHFIESHLFKFDGLIDVNETYIHHGSLHIISVQKGFVAKVYQDNFPRLLGEGDHFIESSQFSYGGMEDFMQQSHVVHGTITLLRVELGQVALAWYDSKPVFIDRPGLYEWDSANFKFVQFKNAEDQLIQLGSKKTILVHTGTVAVTYDKGELKILNHGRHIIDSSTHVFHRFLSTQQRSIRLSTIPASEKMKRSKKNKSPENHGNEQDSDAPNAHVPADPNSDLTICETKDLVRVGVRADVFYSIEDPEKCINRIDTDDLEDLVRETAVATLTNIIRSTALNEIAQSKHVSAGGTAGGLEVLSPGAAGFQQGSGNQEGSTTDTSVSAFFEKAHDEFLDKLHDDFMFRYGVDVANIRIESFRIMDEELAEQISKHALTTAKIENEQANLAGTALISTTREKTAAQVRSINAKAEADSLSTTANAENKRKLEAAQTQAEAMRIEARAKAEAEADAILTKAKAEAEAIRLKAAAEAERAGMLSNTELGRQEALLALYADMVIQSNKGVDKVVYLDPSVNRDSPFAIGSLQNLNSDLHALSRIGIAATSADGTAPLGLSNDVTPHTRNGN